MCKRVRYICAWRKARFIASSWMHTPCFVSAYWCDPHMVMGKAIQLGGRSYSGRVTKWYYPAWQYLSCASHFAKLTVHITHCTLHIAHCAFQIAQELFRASDQVAFSNPTISHFHLSCAMHTAHCAVYIPLCKMNHWSLLLDLNWIYCFSAMGLFSLIRWSCNQSG